MIWWSALLGGVLGAAWGPRYNWEFHVFVGVLLGAMTGWMLRRVVRKEVKAALARAAQVLPLAPPAAAVLPESARKKDPVAPVPETRRPPQAMPDAVATTAVSSGEEMFLPEEPPAPTPVTVRAPAAAPQPASGELLFDKARAWLFGGNTVVRVGVLVLFIGLTFLARYAAEHALFPPELRLAAIAAAGIGLFAAGFRLRSRAADKLGYALSLQGAGVAVLYLTVFAAFRVYQFLPAGAAFAALALICAFSAVIAILQNAMPMAFIGFAGGFAAPVLLSTGQGNHVGLFSYYLLLGVAIAAIAWARAWRPLNLLGFFATFGVATVWGVLKYQPQHLASTQPFLIAFFLVYVAASMLYALRHSLAARKAVDATLVFGVPIVAFSLQAGLVREIQYATAFSSLALGAFYLALGWWLARRRGEPQEASRWLAECCAALGLGFVTLAVPLALDARWTSAVWAVEGAGVYWMGRRQDRWRARAAGLALQGFAAISFLSAVHGFTLAVWPLANPVFVGATMLAAAAIAISWWSRDMQVAGDNRLATAFAEIETGLSPALFWIGFLWWQFALRGEIVRLVPDAQGILAPVFEKHLRIHLLLLAWVGSAFALHHLALPARRRPWPIAQTPAWTVLPALLLAAVHGAFTMDHVFVSGGWLVWPALLAMHALMLRRLDSGPPAAWWPWVHAGGVWLLVLLAGNVMVFAIGRAELWQTAWATVILLVSGTLVLLMLARRRWFEGKGLRWPLDRFARAYLWLAAAPLALAVALGAMVVAVVSNGNARPLPYVPLLNPTDLTVAMAIAACALWLLRLRTSPLPVPAEMHRREWLLGLAAIVFVAINTVWLRVAHQYFGVPWDVEALFASFLVQAGYSCLWTLLALALMVAAFRRGWRGAWMLGAGLLGVTVLKLFVIDLSNRHGSERIFVFIAVGLLMLVVGYFAPIPPAMRPDEDEALPEGASS